MLRHIHQFDATVTDAQKNLVGIGRVLVTVKRGVERARYLMRSRLARLAGRLRAFEPALWARSEAWALAAKPVAPCAASPSPTSPWRLAGLRPEGFASRG